MASPEGGVLAGLFELQQGGVYPETVAPVNAQLGWAFALCVCTSFPGTHRALDRFD
jgi:hypothetical protein